MKPETFPLGDTGIQLLFGNEISEKINQEIRQFADSLRRYPVNGIIEWVPAYTTLTIFYRPDIITYHEICKVLESKYMDLQGGVAEPTSLIYEIPTLYGGESGTDLDFVANYNGITREEVISVHTGQDYLIYMMGFMPGFPYLGGMSPKIAAPRRDNPRAKISAGSVGIAGEQTGIYPIETPGGWQIIGKTPVKLYDPDSKNPILLSSGHYLRFIPISKSEYDEIENAVNSGTFIVKAKKK
ncbi:5-oxoprolinase subunit PxpB [Mesobacillus foraminis]|uniref:Inhibitor of KinA n=1 Tax=Mesobacillus foraminis TaxID=279826 RepID=A0A4R2BE06_9BACI|nr:5-oxoprolinase subunit PxpB [Mesobacillus foraminis]TCN24976.1 inhibitor of KinA [Mesobacillus foraminis]